MNLAALFLAITLIASGSQKVDFATLAVLTIITGILWLVEAFGTTTIRFRQPRD